MQSAAGETRRAAPPMLERWQETAASAGSDSTPAGVETRASGEVTPGRAGAPIEDEPGIVDFVRRGLEAEGFAVEAALDGIEGERLALSDSFDAIVLDLMLPGRPGLEILAAVRRATPGVPVIVLTARGEISDRVTGLDAGAVDYLVKPFSLAELVARLRAQLRVRAQASTSTLRAEDIEVDLLTRKVQRGGRPVVLSTTEFELLVYLLRHHGQVLTREQILARCGATSTTPRPTSWMSTSATCAESSAVPGTRRRYSRCARSAIASAAPADRCAGPRDRLSSLGLRWRLAGWVALVTLLCTGIAFVAVYSGTGTQLRQADRSGDLGRCGRVRRQPRDGHTELAPERGRGRPALRARPALQRQLDAAVRGRPRGRGRARTAPSCSAGRPRTRERPRPSRTARTASRRGC